MNHPALERAHQHAVRFLDNIDQRHVGPCPEPAELIATLGGQLPSTGQPPVEIIDQLAKHGDAGIVASAGPRYFGFVVGGSHPAALAADWLASAWDQNAGFYVLSPTGATIEQIVGDWLLDLLQLPSDAAVGFVTGCQMANFMGLASARQAVLTKRDWDVARDGLYGAPPIRVLLSAQAHGTIDRALAMLGLGSRRVTRIPCDDQGRMLPEPLEAALADSNDATIVCAQAGNVNTGSFDPLDAIGSLCRQHDAWLHIDGAFGLWARASAAQQHLARGAELANSWATDAHKWLNVPYDSGIVMVRDRTSLLAATDYPGDYLVRSERADRCAHTPESSRRARAIPIYAALRELGRSGVADLIDRSCGLARQAADELSDGGAAILNDVVLNQIMFWADPPAGQEHDAFVDAWLDRIQKDGTCWLGGTRWQGRRALRLSVSGWATTAADITASTQAILRCRPT